MNDDFVFYRHSLPHIQPANACYFITFRLANTIPVEVLKEMVDLRQKEKEIVQQHFSGDDRQYRLYNLSKKYFGRYDSWLDRCAHGPSWLIEVQIASIVDHEIKRLDQIRYHLIASCIMPNHVHLLIDTTGFSQISPSNRSGSTKIYPLSDTLRLLKGRTARYCNQALGQSGAFWHPESYDHVVENDPELGRIIRYILFNPVKAGLVQNWKAWKFTYISTEMGEGEESILAA